MQRQGSGLGISKKEPAWQRDDKHACLFVFTVPHATYHEHLPCEHWVTKRTMSSDTFFSRYSDYFHELVPCFFNESQKPNVKGWLRGVREGIWNILHQYNLSHDF